MRNRLFIMLTLILAFFFNRLPVSSAAENTVDPRETAIDHAIGGMEEGSRPLRPQGYAGKNQTHLVSGRNLSPSMDTRVTASAGSKSPAASTSIGNPSGAAGEDTSGNANAGTGNTGANLGGTTNVGTESGSPQGGAQETVTGGAIGATVEGNTNVGTPPSGSTEPTSGSTEPTSGGGSTSNSIVNADANVDLSGGSPAVDANLTVDTNASNLAEVDATATSDVASTDVTATESGTVAGQDLTTAVNEAPVDAILNTEVVATDVPTESEAATGLEADVDPVAADSDVPTADPADGLSTGL